MLEERLFRQHKIDEIHFLAFTNLFTLPGFFAMIPLDRLAPDQNPAIAAMESFEIQVRHSIGIRVNNALYFQVLCSDQ